MYFLFRGIFDGFSGNFDKDKICLHYRNNLNEICQDNFNKIRRLIVLIYTT